MECGDATGGLIGCGGKGAGSWAEAIAPTSSMLSVIRARAKISPRTPARRWPDIVNPRPQNLPPPIFGHSRMSFLNQAKFSPEVF